MWKTYPHQSPRFGCGTVYAKERKQREMKKVAWIGLGRMGLPMATHLVDAGHSVTGYDLSEGSLIKAEAVGIARAQTIKDAVAGADVVFTMLPQGADVLSVYKDPEGILAHATSSTLLVDSSTISIAACHELHSLAKESGFRFLDAPVSGGTVGAEGGTLAFMVGGTRWRLTMLRLSSSPWLRTFSTQVDPPPVRWQKSATT